MAAFTLSATTAQIHKGTWLIGSSSSFGINNYSSKVGSDVTIFNVNLKSGYFVIDNLALGLNLGLTSFSEHESQTTVIAGAFIRYYLPKNFFLGAGYNSVSTTSTGPYGSSTSGYSIPFEVGYAAFITPNIAIEPSIVYVTGDDKGGITYSGMSTGANSAFGVNLGFTVYLNRK